MEEIKKPLTYSVEVPQINGNALTLDLTTGTSILFVGANGSGKTRLSVELEKRVPLVHRIPAHKSLQFHQSVSPKSLDAAKKDLLYGNEYHAQNINRWNINPATQLLTDYEKLLCVLFSESYELSVLHRKAHQKDKTIEAPETLLDRLISIWNHLLPHRKLNELASVVKVFDPAIDNSEYPSSEMSDGERAIFYYIGQCLVAPTNGVIIIDEPELHVHKSILTDLWSAIENERPDCCFIYVTHDLDFAKSLETDEKYILKSYNKIAWDISRIDKDDNFPEEIIVKIIGSRRPILFVEGDGNSFDVNLYQKIYASHLVVSRGGSEAVIHSVSSFGHNKSLHHLSCAGIIDKDDRTPEEIQILGKHNVYVLPVTEIENIFLYEEFIEIICRKMHFDEKQTQQKIQDIQSFVFSEAEKNKTSCAITFLKRRLDKQAKKISFSGNSIEDISKSIDESSVNSTNASKLYEQRVQELNEAIEAKDYDKVIEIYDKKGLITQVGNLIGIRNFSDYILRLIASGDKEVLQFFQKKLPEIN